MDYTAHELSELADALSHRACCHAGHRRRARSARDFTRGRLRPPSQSPSKAGLVSNSCRSSRRRPPTKSSKALRLVQTPNATREGVALGQRRRIQERRRSRWTSRAFPAPAAARRARGFVRRRVPVGGARRSLRVLLHSTDQRTRRRSAAAQSFDAAHLRTAVPVAEAPSARTRASTSRTSTSKLESGRTCRVDVDGVRARLFVNGAPQPALIVNDLKRGVVSGQVGLWIGSGTEAYFRNLQITSR